MPTSPRLASAHPIRTSVTSSLVVELRRIVRSGIGLGAVSYTHLTLPTTPYV